VDYVPMVMEFLEPYLVDPNTKQKRYWTNERERLEIYRDLGWDTWINIRLAVSPSDTVKVKISYEHNGKQTIIYQIWDTPAGKVEERLQCTDDWPGSFNRTYPIDFEDDFRTPRYIEPPFKNASDLGALEYLFPLDNPADEEMILREFKEKKALSEEFNVPLMIYGSFGMDWLIWLNRAEAAVLYAVDAPGQPPTAYRSGGL